MIKMRKQYAVSAVAYALTMILLLTQQNPDPEHKLLIDWAQFMVLIYSGLVVLDQGDRTETNKGDRRETNSLVMDRLLDLSGGSAGVLTAISLFI